MSDSSPHVPRPSNLTTRLTETPITMQHVQSEMDRAWIAAQDYTVQRILAIVGDHERQWIRHSDGAKALPECAYACRMIADEIRRQFGRVTS